MKPDFDHYSISQLIERWSVYNFKEDDLLQYGISGKLHFSIWVFPFTDNISHLNMECYCYENDGEYYLRKTLHRYQIPCESPKLFKITPSTVTRLKKVYLKEDQQRPTATLIPPCNDCTEKDCSEEASMDEIYVACSAEVKNETYDASQLLKIGLSDLVVTIEEIRRFEQEELKNINLHPCAIPNTIGYSPYLAIALEIWESVYIKKEILDTTSSKQAGIAYIKRHHPSTYDKGENRRDSIAAVAISKYAIEGGEKVWRQYIAECKTLEQDS